MIAVGATLSERFTLGEELGQGGMGTVYRGSETGTGSERIRIGHRSGPPCGCIRGRRIVGRRRPGSALRPGVPDPVPRGRCGGRFEQAGALWTEHIVEDDDRQTGDTTKDRVVGEEEGTTAGAARRGVKGIGRP
jgi:hypothetical protein